MFELYAFYVNLLVLFVFLLAKQKWGGGGHVLCSCFGKKEEIKEDGLSRHGENSNYLAVAKKVEEVHESLT